MKSRTSFCPSADWRPGNHLCFLYETDEEHRAVLSSFLQQGLEYGEKVLYLLDQRAPETILKYLKDEGLDLEPYLRRGQLVFLSARETSLDQGKFEPEALINFWLRELEKSVAEKFKGLRVTGEMTWVLQPAPGVDRLIEYEIRMNEFPQIENFLCLCQYDRRRFDPALPMEVWAAHKRGVIGTEILDNLYYLPSKRFSDPGRGAARFDDWLNKLAERDRVLGLPEQKSRRINDPDRATGDGQQVEDSLQESEASFVAFMQYFPGVAVIRDLQGRYLFANESWEQAFGKEKDDWEGKTLEEIWPAEMARYMRKEDQQVIATRVPAETVITFALDSGSRSWLINRFPILDKQGHPVMVGATGVDITARCAAEEALYREKEKYRTLAEKSPLGISVISKDGRYRYLNPKFLEIFGYTLEDIPTGREWFIRAYPNSVYRRQALTAWNNDLKYSQPGELRPRTFTVTCKDGSQKIINFSPVSLEKGEQIVIYEDITERLQAEEALRESEERFRQLVEHAADALFLHDQGKIIEVNQQACYSLGYSREELLQMSILDIEAGLGPQGIQNLGQQKLDTPFTLLGTHRRKDGSTFPVEVKVGNFNYKGRPLRIALARDVTARVQAEEELRQSEAKYRTLVEAAPLGIAIIAKNGQYIYLNPKFKEIFGYTLKDIPTGREWFAKAYPDPAYRHMVITDWKEEAKKPPVGEIRPRTFRVLCKDGAVKVINFRSAVLPTRDWLMFYEDITERVQFQEALAKSEEQYRRLVNQLPAVAFKGYADGRVDFFDDKIESLTGYKKEDFDTGRLNWTDLILQEDIPVTREPLLKALKGNRSYVREYRIRKQNGSILWIQGRGQISCDPSGRIDHISGLFFDISERKELEEALRKSEAEYRLLVNQIPAVVFRGYADWTISCFDRKIEAVTGYTKEDFNERRVKWSDLIPTEEMDYVKGTFIEALKTDKSYVREHRIRKKDGGYAWVHCRGQIFLDPEGNIEYVSGVTFDVTKHKQAEEALRESEQLYRLLAENVTDVIWTTDMNMRITYVSPSVKFMTGFTPEEILHRPVEEILTPASLKLAKKSFAEGLALGRKSFDPERTWNLEMEQYHKDGSTIWIEVQASFLRDESGRPVGTLGVTRDITKRKEAEAALRESEEKLRSLANQLLGAQEQERKRLAAELHDELGHSLLTVKLRLKSLEKQLAPQQKSLKKDMKQILRDVGDTIENVRRLYLDLSPGDLEDLGLTGALRSMIEDFSEVNPGIIWSVKLDCLDELFPAPIQTAIYRIVQEALTNIGKHAHANHISLVASKRDHNVSFNIEDDGKGFNRDKVLATKKTLGLLAMEERVKILGGSFELASQKKCGTRISFTIPVPRESDQLEGL